MFIPCTAHSLNLVGVSSVNFCTEAVNCFDFVQKLYITSLVGQLTGGIHHIHLDYHIEKRRKK